MLAVNPRDARTLSLLALCQGKLGRHETALRDIAEAVGMAPANPEVLYREAVVFAMAGRNAEALQSLRSALDAGFSVRQVAAEEEFRALRESPEFQTMIGQP
jgi:Flp pilus assembly protein TadD